MVTNSEDGLLIEDLLAGERACQRI